MKKAACLMILCFLVITGVFAERPESNVCKTFEDYANNFPNNTNCYYNPDVFLTVPEIIQQHGYQVETYTVTTPDGYILKLFRIPPKNSTQTNPIFLQHGIGQSSASFVALNENSIAFVLSDAGYDIWLGNFRGSSYSEEHTSLKINDKKFWNYTLHELGVYDVRTQLEFIRNQTELKVIYMGYSLGTTAYFVFNSELPEIARDTVEVFIGVAPVAFVNQAKFPVTIDMSLWKFLKAILPLAINRRTPNSIKSRIKNCLPTPEKALSCLALQHLVTGVDELEINPEILPVVVMQNYDSICMKLIDHFIQLLNEGGFRKYDYGTPERNREIYNRSEPPDYDLSNVDVPVLLIRGPNDLVATKENVEQLSSLLPNVEVYVVDYPKFSHYDFVSAKDVKSLVYDYVTGYLKKYFGANKDI